MITFFKGLEEREGSQKNMFDNQWQSHFSFTHRHKSTLEKSKEREIKDNTLFVFFKGSRYSYDSGFWTWLCFYKYSIFQETKSMMYLFYARMCILFS